MVLWKIQFLFILSKLMVTVNGDMHCPNIGKRSKDCVLDEIKRLGDPKEACEDFSNFVCKDWASRQTLKKNEKRRFTYSSLRTDISNLLIGHMENDTYKEPVLIKAQKFYKMCMNEGVVKSEGSLEIAKKLKEFEGYPFRIENSSCSEWQKIYEKMIKFGFNDNVFMSVDVDKSLKSNETIIYIEQGNLVFKNKNNVDKLKEAYKAFVNNSAKELGGAVPNKDEIQKIFDIEQKISKIRKKDGRPVYWLLEFQTISVKELQKNDTSINWKSLLSTLTGIDVDEETVIGTRSSLKYFKELSKIIEVEGDRNVVNYLNFRFIYFSMDKQTVHSLAYKEFEKKAYNMKHLEPRSKSCINILKKGPLQIALSYIFATNYFSEKSRTFLTKKLKKIEKKLIQSIAKNSYLSDSVIKEMIAKLEKMQHLVGFSDKDVDLKFLNKYSEEIKISKTSYFESFYLVEQQRKRELKKKLVNDMRLWMKVRGAFIVNAYYKPRDNLEIYYAGFLQSVFYDENRIRPMNDGAAVFLVGHEKAHSIDTNSQNINSDAILSNWWDNSSKREFNKRVNCLSKIYSDIKLEGLNHTMNFTKFKVEAVADNIAMKHVYAAFKDDLKTFNSSLKKEIEEKYGFTLEQLFWISVGKIFCVKTAPGYLEKILKQNYNYAIGNVRINGFTRNSADFAKDFNCPLKSAMNVENRCTIY